MLNELQAEVLAADRHSHRADYISQGKVTVPRPEYARMLKALRSRDNHCSAVGIATLRGAAIPSQEHRHNTPSLAFRLRV